MRFINQGKTLLEQSAKLLLKEKSRGNLPFDLSHQSVLVPNLQAKRMLREALAYHSSQQNSGVLSPHIYTPKSFLEEVLAKVPNIASSIQIKWAWAEILCQVSGKNLTPFLPQLPEKRTLQWALPIVDILIRTRDRLMTNGWTFKTAYQKIKPLGWVQNRWKTWVYLEEAYFNRLRQDQWRDPAEELLKSLEKDCLFLNFSPLILLGCPNLPPLLEKFMGKLSHQSEIETWVYASPDEKSGFNRWGRPLKTYWNKLSQDLNLDSKVVNLFADPDTLAQNVGKIWKKENWKKHQVAVGLLDLDLKSPLSIALGDTAHFFDPSKDNKRLRPWLHPLHIWKELQDGNLEVFIEWASQTFIKKQWLGKDCPETWLKNFYKYQQKHKLYNLQQARSSLSKHKPWLINPFKLLDELQFRYSQEGVFAFIKDTWQIIYDSSPETVRSSYHIVHDALNLLEKKLFHKLSQLSSQESLTFILNCLSAIQSKAENNEGKISLSGWLDLLWNPASNLLILGLHEGKLSSNDNINAYLPESLQLTLGIPTSVDQYAINAYIFKRILSSRKSKQQKIWLSKKNTSGEPLKPDHLLFHGKREHLAERTEKFFMKHSPPNPISVNDWVGDWKQPLHPNINKISVTHFVDFLQCPFRFYLKNVLGMQKPNQRKWEMEPKDYGTLFHQSLEEYYQNLKSGTTFSEKSLQKFFNYTVEKVFLNRFGKSQNALLQIQKHSQLQRLQSGIPLLLERTNYGWSVEAIEKPFKETHIIQGKNIEISGKIDLIESHPDKGIHLIDFKTFEQSVSPHDKHLQKISTIERDYPDWQIAIRGERPSIWVDLQIPMYVNHLKKTFPNRKILASYLVFPAAVCETGFYNWENLTEEYLQSASSCRDGVLRKITDGNFHPTRTSVANDTYKELIEKGAFKNLLENFST